MKHHIVQINLPLSTNVISVDLKSFVKKGNLEIHERSCSQTLLTEETLNKHPLECQICFKTLSRATDMKRLK